MGIDAGFDMVPRLSRDPDDKRQWSQFLELIESTYEHDEKVVLKDGYIEFEVGEHPKLPFDGHLFLRFSSKVSGSCAPAWRYIDEVRRVAHSLFGSRVQPWNEARDLWGFYDWIDVHESIRSYTKVGDGFLISTGMA
jgi:hypothetical protein